MQGEVFTVGENNDGQLGLGSIGSKVEVLSKVPGLEDTKVVKASCGR